MAHGFVRAVIVIRDDGIVRECRVRAHDKNKRNVDLFYHLLHRRPEVFGSLCEQDTVDSFGKEELDCTLLLVEDVVAVAKKQIIAVLLRSILSSADHHGKERIAEVRDDHTNRVRPAVRKPPRNKIRPVVEFANRGLHTFTKTLADVSFLVHDSRDGEDRNTGFAGNVIDAGRLPSLLSRFLRGTHESSVCYGNRLLLSCRLINCIEDDHIAMPLDAIGFDTAFVLDSRSERIHLREELVGNLKSLFDPPFSNFSGEAAFFVKREGGG